MCLLLKGRGAPAAALLVGGKIRALFVAAFVVPIVLAIVRPRWWLVGLALVLPAAAYGIEEGGFDTHTDEGFENWGLVALPVICVVCGSVTALIVAIAKLRSPPYRSD